jgi:glycerophosphoryl diester phosphodiesterase
VFHFIFQRTKKQKRVSIQKQEKQKETQKRRRKMGQCFSTPVCGIKIEDHVAYYGAAKLNRPLIYGHRGGSKNFPENTVEAFKDALANGADGCELDVFLTKDKHIVCFHDDTTERLLDGPQVTLVDAMWKGDLENRKHKKSLTYDRETLEFKEQYPVSLLEDVFVAFKGKKSNSGLPFVLNVELKPAKPSLINSKVGTHVANLVRKHKMEAQVTIVAFDPLKLLQVERAYEGLHTGWQYDDDLINSLGTANTWFNEPSFGNEAEFSRDRSGATRFLMENALLDRAIGATIVDLEHTVCDDNTIQKFHDKKFAVGCFAFFPTDLSSVHNHPPADDEGAYHHSKNILRQVMKRKVNWIETDSVKLSLKAIAEINAEFNADASASGAGAPANIAQ